ncbi:MAG: type II/IV secretion system ATPase subunit [Methanosarcinaceae archaeon]|nr:type II/IV secretion system ATPase subunit [Methanosarcinaceae archaeon]
MADDGDDNLETIRSSEIVDKKKADRDLLLKKFRQNKDQLGVGQSSNSENEGESSSISAVRSAYGIKKSEPSEQINNGLDDSGTGPKLFRPKAQFELKEQMEPKSVSSNLFDANNNDKTVEQEVESGILTPSGNSGNLLNRLADKRSSEEKKEREFGILVPGPSMPKSSTSGLSNLSETPDKETENEDEIDSHESLQSTVETGKIEGIGEEKKDISLEDDKQEFQKSSVEEPVEGEEPASDLVKNLIEEASTKNISKDIVQDDDEIEEEVEKEKIGFIDKIKNLFKQEEVEVEPYDPELHGPLCMFRGVAGYEELERRWVNEPYAFVVVLFNEEKNHSIYYVVEPELSEFEETFLTEIKDRLRNVLLVEELGEEKDRDVVLENKIRVIIKDYAIEITPPMLAKITYYIKRDFIRFGKLDPLMFDDTIEDVSGNGHDTPIFLYHKKYTNIETNIVYQEDELNSFIIRLAQRSGKHISVAEPMVDATMGDGSRIQMTLGTTITTHGSTFTIRKFSDVPITPIDLIKWKTFSAESMAYLWLCIENNKSLIYAGGTASGKTSSLNAVSLFIPEKAKVITLEDTRELKLPHINWIPALTRDSFTADDRGAIDMYDLLKGALRQRPEYLLVGEVRGKEALTLFQAMSTGHTTFSTMHADSVSSAIHRLENPPISVPRTMIQALDIVCIQSQTYSKGKRVRRNLYIVEIVDIDPNTRNIRTNDIFGWDSTTDTFHKTGESKALADIQMRRGWTSAQVRQELIYRQKVLEYMVNNDVTDYQEISGIINAYQATPEKVLKKLKLV